MSVRDPGAAAAAAAYPAIAATRLSSITFGATNGPREHSNTNCRPGGADLGHLGLRRSVRPDHRLLDGLVGPRCIRPLDCPASTCFAEITTQLVHSFVAGDLRVRPSSQFRRLLQGARRTREAQQEHDDSEELCESPRSPRLPRSPSRFTCRVDVAGTSLPVSTSKQPGSFDRHLGYERHTRSEEFHRDRSNGVCGSTAPKVQKGDGMSAAIAGEASPSRRQLRPLKESSRHRKARARATAGPAGATDAMELMQFPASPARRLGAAADAGIGSPDEEAAAADKIAAVRKGQLARRRDVSADPLAAGSRPNRNAAEAEKQAAAANKIAAVRRGQLSRRRPVTGPGSWFAS